MKPDLSPVEQLSHSTVRIECEFPDGSHGTGTGFFYSLARDGRKHVPVIVTNNHVIADATIGRFLLTLRTDDNRPDYGNSRTLAFRDFAQMWHPHPDPDVDLCAMPIAPLLRQAQSQGEAFFFVTLEGSLLPTQQEIDDFVGLGDITMVGYPNGLWDSVNNLPLFRRGVLASDYKIDWNGRKEFLIDAACFPGSSGSPVLLCNVGGYRTKSGTQLGGSRIKLLGILYAGPQHTVEGEIRIVNVPIHQKPVSVTGIPNNLGIVIKAEQVVHFDALFQT